MSNFQIDITASSDGDVVGSASEDLFGGILINQSDFADFSQDYDELGLTFVRFPGGAFAEDGIVVDGEVSFSSGTISFNDLLDDRSNLAFDLTFPELFNPDLLALDEADGGEDDYASLSEAMEFCIENSTVLSIILPTTRYYSGVDLTNATEMAEMVSVLEADLVLFLDHLAAGDYNDGQYPDTIILEIGNETYGSPVEYAVVAQVYIDTIEDVLGSSDINYEIAFQMNVGSSQFKSLDDQGYFDTYFDSEGNALIPQLDGFTYYPDDYHSYGERILMIEEMMAHIIGESVTDIDLLRHHYLAIDSDVLNDEDAVINQRDDILRFWYDEIDANGGSSTDVSYYVSAWTTDSSNADDAPAGLAAATNTLMLFAEFMDLGVDMAAAWGINGSEAYWPTNSPTTVLTFSNQEGVTPGGQILQMLSDDVIGLTHIESSVDTILDAGDPTDYLEFIYTSKTKTVLFYSVGDLDGNSLTIDVDLSEFGSFGYADIENLGTSDGSAYGLAVVEESTQTLQDNTASIMFDQDYEVVKIVVYSNGIEGSASRTVATGTSGADYLSGTEGPDELSGWGGGDTILGQSGNDVIYGNDGNDLIYGGNGNDKVNGGIGWDMVYGGFGNDIVNAMDGFDTIYGDDGDDVLNGNAGNDTIYGGEGKDFLDGGIGFDVLYGGGGMDELRGMDGYDALFGGDGNDTLYGNFGNDRLDGGAGNDVLSGGKGADQFVFAEGMDRIVDFKDDLDTLYLSSDLWGGGSRSNSAVLDFAEVVGGDVVFDFGGGNTLTIENLSNVSSLSDDLIMF